MSVTIGQKIRVAMNAFESSPGVTIPAWIDYVFLRGQIVRVVDFNKSIVVVLDMDGEIHGLYPSEVEALAHQEG